MDYSFEIGLSIIWQGFRNVNLSCQSIKQTHIFSFRKIARIVCERFDLARNIIDTREELLAEVEHLRMEVPPPSVISSTMCSDIVIIKIS